MKYLKNIVCGAMILATTCVFADQIPEGVYKSTSSTAGDCPNCTIKISKPAPHILEITANNDWVGYAYYNQSRDMYKGAMEWKSGKGGVYENHVFLLEIIYEGRTITKKAVGTTLTFSTTYRKK